jgi:hypothetical protein
MAAASARPLLQIGAELGAILLYIWVLQERAPAWVSAAFVAIVCVGFPVYCLWSDQHVLAEFRANRASFQEGFRWLAGFTVIMSVVVIAMGVAANSLHYDGDFAQRFPRYVFWAFVQQVGFQLFLTRRVEGITANRQAAAAMSALLFAALHLPNPVLMALCLVGGFAWALCFLHRANLYALALSHAWLAVLVLYCTPPAWLHNLRIGPAYWRF